MKLRSLKKKRIQSRIFVLFKIKFIKLNMKKSRSLTIDAKNTEFISSSIDVENAESMLSSISFKKRDRKFKEIDFDVNVDVDVDRKIEIEINQKR